MKPPDPAGTRRHHITRRRRIVLLAALTYALQIFACQRNVQAQEEPTAPTGEEVIRVQTDLVVVPFYVTDGRGRRVPGLSRDNFQVLDNGRPVETSYFAAGAEHVALLFLLDASGSTREIVTQQRETALALFSHFGERSRVAVMQFRERPEPALPFTRDLRAARAAFQIASLPDRRTAIFDAALASVRAFRPEDTYAGERRIVVLFSDGLDTASATPAAQVIEEARATGVSFYVIHLPLYEPRDGHLAPRRPTRGFRDLAEKTGGRLFVVGDARTALDPRAEHDLGHIFRAIAEDLQSQYVLGYHAADAGRDAGVHRVHVRLNAPLERRLRVRQLREAYESKR